MGGKGSRSEPGEKWKQGFGVKAAAPSCPLSNTAWHMDDVFGSNTSSPGPFGQTYMT